MMRIIPYCSDCGEELEIYEREDYTSFPQTELLIVPCKYCQQAQEEEIREEIELTFNPVLKAIRIDDSDVVEFVRDNRDGCCMYGLFYGGECAGVLHPHHIKSKGSGGDDDVKNLITLCAKHHDEAHRGLIERSALYHILTDYYHYEMEEPCLLN